MAGLTFNGRPFDPKEFEKKIMDSARDKAAEHIRQKVAAIRNPQSGEFPTAQATVRDDGTISLIVEGSADTLAGVEQRLIHRDEENENTSAREQTPVAPKAFLSYAWEDRDLAERIALALMASGIDTWWAGWSIGAGDSLPQKINEGLSDCTHFIVLLTPTSVNKPWVQHEMDAGLIRKISDQRKFIPLRHKLSAEHLPPLLRPILSPKVNDPPTDIQQVVNDIYGLSKKPTLGPTPGVVRAPGNKQYSSAANLVAKVFVERSETACFADPQLRLDELVAATGLTEDDVTDAIHEIRDLVTSTGHGISYPVEELFVRFDEAFRDWSPSEDALQIAVDMVNDPSFPSSVPEVAARLAWSPRRLNSAISYLFNRDLISASKGIGHPPWVAIAIRRTDETRRFVRSRAS